MSGEQDLPVTWAPDRGIRWKTPLTGQGTSSPIVWDQQVIVTMADGPRQSDLHMVSLSLLDGQEQWRLRLWGTAPTLHHGTKSDMATPTPVTDGERVYALFGTGDVICCSQQGELQWQRSLAQESGPFENRFGHTSSPLLYRDLLVVQCDHYGASYLVAIDTATGADRWRVDRSGTWHSWSSPQLLPAERDGEPELVLCAAERIDAFRPSTGEKLWTVSGMRRECIPTPVIGHGMLFAVSGPSGRTFAIRPGGKGDVTESHIAWTSQRGSPFVPSPILVGNNYYLVDDRGIATCLDAHSGKPRWQKRLPGAYTASPIAGDGKVYFTNEDGLTTVIEVSDKYQELARNPLPEPIYASGAIAHGCILLRSLHGLYCVDGKRR